MRGKQSKEIIFPFYYLNCEKGQEYSWPFSLGISGPRAWGLERGWDCWELSWELGGRGLGVKGGGRQEPQREGRQQKTRPTKKKEKTKTCLNKSGIYILTKTQESNINF